VLDDYEQADLVIIAKMKLVTKNITPTRFGGDKNHAIMTVQRVFKGDVTAGQELTFGQGDPTLGCSWALYENYVGEEYLLLFCTGRKNRMNRFITQPVTDRDRWKEAVEDLL
jgi:hypothetical protein